MNEMVVPDTITDRATADRFIDAVRAENETLYAGDLGQGAVRDFQQTFPHSWLYVGELLQNAVDAGATHIRLAEVPEGLLFEHDGAAFEPKHVRALCARGVSTKGAGTVGFMGIGFKAVFHTFERASISSGPWRFGFTVKENIGEYDERLRDWLGCVLPEHADAGEPSAGMRCRFLLTNRVARAGSVGEDVARALSSDLVVLALLAHRGVEELTWNDQRWELKKDLQVVQEETARYLLSAREVGTGNVRSWILFSASYQPSRDAIRRFLEHRNKPSSPEGYAEASRSRTVDAFCPLDAQGVPVPPKRGHAYALLATGASVPLGLHVQADWLLNTSRQELMEVEENAWHQEILGRLAGLLRSYLAWVTSIAGLTDQQLSRSYAVLPSWSDLNGEFGTYLQGRAFLDSLRAALGDLAFLPVRTPEGTRFGAPSVARLLPVGLRGFDTPALRPWILFGQNIISTTVLGDATLSSVQQVGIIQDLTPEELVEQWREGAVGAWRGALGDAGKDAHARLLRTLATLDSEPSWRSARLCCLPTASGGWIDRESVHGLPLDWGFVPDNEPAIRSWLETILPPPHVRLDWEFDRSVLRDAGVQSYLASVRRESLDELFGKWWDFLPRAVDDEACERVLAVTSWVRNKQKQRQGLVKRVLVVDGPGLSLVGFAEAVLAAPYASPARGVFYPAVPPVSDRYLSFEPGSSEASWRSFFEEASGALRGPLRLARSVQKLTKHDLSKALPGYTPPSHRTVLMRASWEGNSFTSDNYLLVDHGLPEELTRVLGGVISREVSASIAAWLDENRQVLLSEPKMRVMYVPYNSSAVSRSTTGVSSSWVTLLQRTAWLYAADESGPYTPDQVLARVDMARPDAPVAALPAGLLKTLADCGVTFGTTVPDVLSVERLRREGPSAALGRLIELVGQAVGDTSGDGQARAELVVVCRSVALVPVPKGLVLVDGASRVCGDRFVVRSARGADLGGWLLSTDALSKDGSEHALYERLFELFGNVFDIPQVPTGLQALSFLAWVWGSQPDAESVRRLLPRLYRLVAEDVAAGGLSTEWGRARGRAMVYVASRRWVSVLSEDLYLDDLGEDRLKGLVGGLLLATPGHLGESPEDQRRVAGLLGVRLLSTRFTLELRPEGERSLPDGWLSSLQSIVDLAYAFGRDENEEVTTPVLPDFRYYARLEKSLLDGGAVTHSWEVRAARDGARVLLSGEPREFMADLCRVVLQWAGLSGRRDLDDLAPTLTQLIGYVGSPGFAQRLDDVRFERGMTTPPPAPPGPAPTPAPAPPGPTDGPVPGPSGPMPTGDSPAPGDGGAGTTGDGTQQGGHAGGQGPKPAPGGGEETGGESGAGGAPGPSGGWTAGDRERRLRSLRKKKAELDAQEKELLGTGPLPPEEPEPGPGDGEGAKREFGTDVPYRDAVVAFELANGRYAEVLDAKQPGRDIDSYDRPLDDPARLLVRCIEVKGHGNAWTDDETVELSDRQFLDAFNRRTDGVAVTADFDYWLYVVERQNDGTLHVIPIQNPSRRAAKFEFRAGTWRAMAEEDGREDGHSS